MSWLASLCCVETCSVIAAGDETSPAAKSEEKRMFSQASSANKFSKTASISIYFKLVHPGLLLYLLGYLYFLITF